MRHRFGQRHYSLGIVDDEVAKRTILESCRVRHYVPERDRLLESVTNLEVLEIRIDVGIEVQFPFLDELHDGEPGEQLGDGAGTEKGLIGVDRDLLFEILVAVALCKDEFAVSDNGDRAGRTVVVLHQGPHGPVDKRLEHCRVVDIRRLGGPGRRK